MTQPSEHALRVAVVGCGTIAERQHIPRLKSRADVRVVALVDRDLARAEQLAGQHGIPLALADYRELFPYGVEAVVLAVPNHLHAPISIDLLRAGVHVLVEKPMAPTVADCDAMLAAAEEGHAVLAVGLVLRYAPSSRFVKWAVERGTLGEIVSFEMHNGVVFDWPTHSDYLLRPETAGGGVLMDLGVHTLDLLLWWLGDVESFEYYDDNYGGVEADCTLRATLSSGAEGSVELSRTRDLGSRAILRGERAELEVVFGKKPVVVRGADAAWEVSGEARRPEAPGRNGSAARHPVALEHDDFLTAIRTGRPPVASGREGRRSITLIAACYERRRPLHLPWVEPQRDVGEKVAV